MEYEHEGQVVTFLSGLLLGAVIGAGVALLTAPQPGKKTRRRLRKRALEVRDSAGERLEALADEVKGRVDDAFEGARRRLSH